MRIDRETETYCPLAHGTGCTNTQHKELRIHYPVDNLIAPILTILHNKGYKTRFCCSGHPDNLPQGISASITFAFQYAIDAPDGFKFTNNSETRIEAVIPRRDKRHPYTVDEANVMIDNNIRILTKWANNLPTLEEYTEIGQRQNYPVSVPVYAAECVQRIMDEGILPYSVECSASRLKGVVKGRVFGHRSISIQDIMPFTGVECSEFNIAWDEVDKLIDACHRAE